jgi:homoserine dehydrogenase
MQNIREVLVGLGTVAKGLCGAIAGHQSSGPGIQVVGIATRRIGFAYKADGFDMARLQSYPDCVGDLLASPDLKRWSTTEDGLHHVEFDVLADTTGPPLKEAPACVSRMQDAMRSGASVITSSKWAVASALHQLMDC